jgi:hypothetical protein
MKLTLIPLFGLLVLVTGCITKPTGHGYSLCAMCGYGRDSKTFSWGTNSVIKTNEVAEWLAPHIPENCEHNWICIAGEVIGGGHWWGYSNCHRALSAIKKLESEGKGPGTTQLLNRYFALLEPGDRAQQFAKVEEYHQELITMLNQTDNKEGLEGRHAPPSQP